MQRKNAFDSFSVGDAANSKVFVQSATFAADDDTRKNLDALLVAFYHPGVHAHSVADAKFRDLGFELVLFNGIDDTIHSGRSFSGRSISADVPRKQLSTRAGCHGVGCRYSARPAAPVVQ